MNFAALITGQELKHFVVNGLLPPRLEVQAYDVVNHRSSVYLIRSSMIETSLNGGIFANNFSNRAVGIQKRRSNFPNGRLSLFCIRFAHRTVLTTLPKRSISCRGGEA